MNTQRILRINF